MLYKLIRSSHGRVENGKNKRYFEGDTIDCSPAEAEALGDRLQLVLNVAQNVVLPEPEVSEPEPEVAKPEVEDDKTEAFQKILNFHWKLASKRISKLETIDDVIAVRELEVEGKNRTSVVNALDARLEELSEAE